MRLARELILPSDPFTFDQAALIASQRAVSSFSMYQREFAVRNMLHSFARCTYWN
jgi:hypothetical protein